MHLVKFFFNTLEPKLRRYFAPDITARPTTLLLKNNGYKDIIAVEIGVANGVNALNMLRELPIKHLYLVDPYIPYVDGNVRYDHSNLEVNAHRRLKSFNDKITFIRDISENAVNFIPDGLDCVYVDGNHQEEYVIMDCELYYPKIKTGGILGGHDFNSSFMGVPKGVLKFANKYGLEVNGKKDDWWIWK